MENLTFNELPINKDIELAILGCVFLNNDIIYKLIDNIDENYFFDPKNKIIFSCFKELALNKQNIDVMIVSSYLNEKKLLDKIGGYDYLYTISSLEYSYHNIDNYIDILKDAYLKRECILKLQELINKGYDGKLSSFDYIEDIEKSILNLTKKRNISSFKPIKEVTESILLKTEASSNSKSEIIGLRTGFNILDKITLGFQKGQLIILAARPAMGKSAMAINIAFNVATLNESSTASVAIISLEMPSEQLVERLIASDSKIKLNDIKTGTLQKNDWLRFNSSCSRLSKLNIYFDDSVDLNISKIKAKCRKLATESKLDFIVIDYLQLIKGDTNTKSIQEEVALVSRNLKLMAMELQVPVLALSQLSRKTEQRDEKIPIMADLRDSGSIEQDADIIMFLYRDEYYNKQSTRIGEADLIVAKNRNGSTIDQIPLMFSGAYSCFEDK